MSLRRFYRRINTEEVIQNIFFVLNTASIKDECPICYEQINDSENSICHECKKPMHLSCIESWFNTNEMRTCPHCRSNWKFEIDIIEKPKPIYIELGEYSEMPDYRRTSDQVSVNRLTVRGSVSGSINRQTHTNHGNINYQNFYNTF
jgi:hypothetical protein